MTESSRFWTTSGTGDGPGGGYAQDKMYDFLRKIFTTDQYASQGPIYGEQGELAVTGTSSPLSVAAGSAIVYGFFYENTSSLNLTVTTPVIGTTGGRVNLQANWTAQTVRAVVSMSADGTPTIPSLTQTPGSVYEVPLATFTITTGGAITLTDARSFIEIGAKVQTNAVSTAAIQNDAVDDTKAGNRVPQFYRRLGGSSSNWETPGSTTYTPTSVRMQGGTMNVNNSATPHAHVTITFPVAFSNVPLGFVTIKSGTTRDDYFGVCYCTSQYMYITIFNNSYDDGENWSDTVTFSWLAIGPE